MRSLGCESDGKKLTRRTRDFPGKRNMKKLGSFLKRIPFGLASISTVLEMTNGTTDLGEADDKLLVAEPRHGCWGVGKF